MYVQGQRRERNAEQRTVRCASLWCWQRKNKGKSSVVKVEGEGKERKKERQKGLLIDNESHDGGDNERSGRPSINPQTETIAIPPGEGDD